MMLSDLPESVTEALKLGDTVYLIRKVSGHVLEMELTSLGRQGRPLAEVAWKNQRCFTYKLDLELNEVIAQDASPKHRADMKRCWEVWEPHRKLLKELFYDSLRKAKK